jgi:hypothetical protein
MRAAPSCSYRPSGVGIFRWLPCDCLRGWLNSIGSSRVIMLIFSVFFIQHFDKRRPRLFIAQDGECVYRPFPDSPGGIIHRLDQIIKGARVLCGLDNLERCAPHEFVFIFNQRDDRFDHAAPILLSAPARLLTYPSVSLIAASRSLKAFASPISLSTFIAAHGVGFILRRLD